MKLKNVPLSDESESELIDDCEIMEKIINNKKSKSKSKKKSKKIIIQFE